MITKIMMFKEGEFIKLLEKKERKNFKGKYCCFRKVYK